MQTGQGYLKYRSNLKNVLPSPYIFLLGGGEGTDGWWKVQRRSKDRRNNTWNQLLYFYFYNILSHPKKMYAASKIIFTQLCFSSHKNSIYFNDNYRHVKKGRPGKKNILHLYFILVKCSPRTLSIGYFLDGDTRSKKKKKKKN